MEGMAFGDALNKKEDCVRLDNHLPKVDQGVEAVRGQIIGRGYYPSTGRDNTSMTDALKEVESRLEKIVDVLNDIEGRLTGGSVGEAQADGTLSSDTMKATVDRLLGIVARCEVAAGRINRAI